MLTDYENSPTFPKIKKRAHKYSHGRVMSVVGSEQYPGAALLSLAAVRTTNIGYLCWRPISENWANVVLENFPEIVLAPKLGEVVANSWLFGSGIADLEFCEKEFSQCLIGISKSSDKLQEKIYLTIDGASVSLASKSRADFTIITPHEKEAAVFNKDVLNKDVPNKDVPNKDLEENKISEQNLNNRKEFAKDIAKQTGAITVLKGNHTVIATPSGLTSIDRIGGVELAKAGTGDILAGLISGFLATWKPQNEKEVFRVVSRAVKVHSQAGRYAKSRYKYPTTTQILNALPKIYRA